MSAQRVSREIATDCQQCQEARLCPLKGEMHRAAAVAWAYGRTFPSCPFLRPAWERGIEGVLASPHPSPGRRSIGQSS